MGLLTPEQRRKGIRFYQNIKAFVKDVLCPDDVRPDDFIAGTQHIEFYGDLIEKEHQIFPKEVDLGGTSYEEALLARIMERTDLGTLVLLGGLGAGKTTTVRYVLYLLHSRRENLRITKCMEHCAICSRQPLYVNCIEIGGFNKAISVDDAISSVTQKIRDAIYDQIIFEWLARNSMPKSLFSDSTLIHAIRRLIITNDLKIWAAENRISGVDLYTPPELDAKTPILKLVPDEATISKLVERFEQHLVRLDGWLGRMHHNQKDNIDFTSTLLRFYLSKCPPHNPQNFLIIDNLEQLPTRHIEEVAKFSQRLSSVDPSFLIVLPLRPSSILTPGHIRTTEVWYHYGPNCYEMLLHRLERYVLSRSKSDLLGLSETPEPGLRSPFLTKPTDEELNLFLLAVYLVASILAAGSREFLQGRPNLKIHSDHHIISRIRVPSGSARSVASTLGALVGTCARYANEQLSRYFRSIYSDPSELFDAIGRQGPQGSKATLAIPYKLIMDTIVFDTGANVPVAEHIANLFSPTRRGANDRLPSLVKIRILKFLRRWKRATVRDVVRHLSLYGIPAEISIEGLNSLHDKNRLLLWFSENHELTSETHDGNQYVVISEHGLGYLEHVIGDFEYVWACAANMNGKNSRDSRFVVRLSDYENLVTNLGETEWKQLAFRRCLGNYVQPKSGSAEYRELTTLSILYKSLSRALRSSEPIFRRRGSHTPDENQTREETQSLIERLCELIKSWQERYLLCYVGPAYRNIYTEWRREAYDALKRVVEFLDQSRPGFASVDETLEELSLSSWEQPPVEPRWGRIALKEDYVTFASQFLRSFLPFPAEWTRALDKNVARRLMLERLTDSEVRLGALLSKSLPSYREVEEAASDVLKNMNYMLLQMEQTGVATGSLLYENLLRERDSISGKLDAMKYNLNPDSPPCSSIEMSERKDKFNNMIAIYRELGERFSPEHRLEHLRVSWH